MMQNQTPNQQRQNQDKKPDQQADRKAEIKKAVEQDKPDKTKGQENTEYSGGS
jgi:hypothetical protein